MCKENKNNLIQQLISLELPSAYLMEEIKIILICFLKMNEGFKGLERHDGDRFFFFFF